MPKVGVGILASSGFKLLGAEFQSIYAQSGRWNKMPVLIDGHFLGVSIHLCPKWALELNDGPMQPDDRTLFQSIYAQSGRWNNLTSSPKRLAKVRFNPSMPKVGVGMAVGLLKPSQHNKFQSIYAQSGRWNCLYHYRKGFNL